MLVRGELDMSAAPSLLDALTSTARPSGTLVVDLSQVTFVDSAATQRNDVEIAGVRRDGSHFPMLVSTTAMVVDEALPSAGRSPGAARLGHRPG